MSKIIVISFLLLLVACGQIQITPTAISSPANTSTSIETPTPSMTPTETLVPTFTPFPKEIMEAKDVPMRLVPEGEFAMSTDHMGDDGTAVAECWGQPASCQKTWLAQYFSHVVYLDAFYIDTYEVTNALYKSCVDMGVCQPPQKTSSYTHSSYYGNSEFDNFPVIYVDWYMAKTYCEWRGARLPTEAEWEKTARSSSGYIYPWGNYRATFAANYDKREGDTVKVGNYESGCSLYGVYDMAGNVWEWVSSLHEQYPYNATDGREDLDASGDRILRGGSWDNGPSSIKSVYRKWSAPTLASYDIGFRCARSIAP